VKKTEHREEKPLVLGGREKIREEGSKHGVIGVPKEKNERIRKKFFAWGRSWVERRRPLRGAYATRGSLLRPYVNWREFWHALGRKIKGIKGKEEGP